MSEFMGLRRILISLAHHVTSLPRELERFALYPTEIVGVYDTPYTAHNSPEWADFEQVLTLLENRGICTGWKVLDVH